MKRLRWRMRRFSKAFFRTYKGVFDILAILLFVAGAIAIMSGVMLALCEEWYSVLYITGGFVALCMADDFIFLDRRRGSRR